MTNEELIRFVIEDRKVPYNDQLLVLTYQYFKLVIEDLEKKNNFNYMRRTSLFTLLKDNYSVNFTEDIKQFNEIVDKQRRMKLTGDEDTKMMFAYSTDIRGVPSRFLYIPNTSSIGGTLYFDCAAIENIDYIVDYYVYTYRSILVEPTQSHPLLFENKTLLLHSLSYWIERYFTADLTLEEKAKTMQEAIERSVETKQRFKKAKLKFYLKRYE
ncbi:MAG: hypothetical protein P3W91_005540 [Fervidobacterium sp.]|nr:hypothetical protein [Fervidobacterium sp.]